MFKKIIMWALYGGIVGLLIFGAANRTSAKTDQGLLFDRTEDFTSEGGRGNGGSGNGGQSGEAGLADYEEKLEEHDWMSLSGQIINVGSEALEIQTDTAGILEIEGRSWRFAQELGYVPGEGNEVSVQGFYENGEFEVSMIQDLTTDQVFQLRDEYGKPMWGGGGRN
jgi:hypothetical protein